MEALVIIIRTDDRALERYIMICSYDDTTIHALEQGNTCLKPLIRFEMFDWSVKFLWKTFKNLAVQNKKSGSFQNYYFLNIMLFLSTNCIAFGDWHLKTL